MRRHFQDRYRCLFVDEFQDTDPIQAEILLYLTGENLEETDWRKLTPRPGSLFLVGDGKQSIYRFRRADVETFDLVRNRIDNTNGDIVGLNTNFRSLGHLCDWINAAFEPLFVAHKKPYQAEFAPLFKYRSNGETDGGPPNLNRQSLSQQPKPDRGTRRRSDSKLHRSGHRRRNGN